jgi:hypothetical protein
VRLVTQTSNPASHSATQTLVAVPQPKGKHSDKNTTSSITNLSSIPKPSVGDPFTITTSNKKLLGKSNISLLSENTDQGTKESPPHTSCTHQHVQHGTIASPSIANLLPPIQPHPLNQSETPDWLIPMIAMIIKSDQTTLDDSPFIFDMNPEAASHNSLVLSSHGDDLGNVINAYQNSFLRYGSEFRPSILLANLLMHHPRWVKFKSLLDHGSKWPLRPIDSHTRKARNKELLERGNHQSAITHDSILQLTLQKEVQQGWMLPIPTSYIGTLLNAEIAPVGITPQWQAHENGSRTQKFRLTHDQSFEASIGESVNKRVEKDQLDELFYGHCITRILHYIISTRIYLPTTRILIAKTDFKGAYRRVTLHSDTAPRCTIINGSIALMSLRLTFGGSPCPNEFCIISELCADLGNDILHSSDWEPRLLHSPHTINLPTEIPDSSQHPLSHGLELDVDIPFDKFGKIEIYIDDGITIIPDIDDNATRGTNAMALAIHTICRPLATLEPIKREDCLSLSKLAEEGTLSETAIVLGWLINTRKLTISLPADKFNSWRIDINTIISQRKATIEDLECLIGRLNHAASVLSLARYFLNRLRRTLTPSDGNLPNLFSKQHKKWLSKSTLADLQLFHDIILPKIHKGININLLTYRRPTHILFSDACPKGLGGYSANTGKAWRWPIPSEFIESVLNKNNLLEFLAAIITIWLQLLDSTTQPLPCLLALTDNSSAVGWLHKANIDEAQNKALHIASRKLATLVIEADCCLYSQHFKGAYNNVADALSRHNNLTDHALTSFILSHFPNQVPVTFVIDPLPPSITSWMTWLLQKNKEHTEFKIKQKRKRSEPGTDGKPTWHELKTPTILTSNSSNPSCERESSVPSQPPSDEEIFQEKIKKTWVEAQSKRPWQSWVRCLGQTWGSTPTMVQTGNQHTQS